MNTSTLLHTKSWVTPMFKCPNKLSPTSDSSHTLQQLIKIKTNSSYQSLAFHSIKEKRGSNRDIIEQNQFNKLHQKVRRKRTHCLLSSSLNSKKLVEAGTIFRWCLIWYLSFHCHTTQTSTIFSEIQ